jgi:hypothetical protein
MGYRIRKIDAESNFCHELRIEIIERVLPTDDIAQALATEGVVAQQVRKFDLLFPPGCRSCGIEVFYCRAWPCASPLGQPQGLPLRCRHYVVNRQSPLATCCHPRGMAIPLGWARWPRKAGGFGACSLGSKTPGQKSNNLTPAGVTASTPTAKKQALFLAA